MKKMLPLLALIMLISSCGKDNLNPPVSNGSWDVDIITGSLDTSAASKSEIELLTEATLTTLPDETALPDEQIATTTEPPAGSEIITTPVPDVYETLDYEYKYEPYSELYELENGTIAQAGKITEGRDGFSGAGTVSAYGDGEAVSAQLDIPSDGHYNITLRLYAKTEASGRIWCKDNELSFVVNALGADEYESLRYDSIYLSKGKHDIILGDFDGEVELDCLLVESTDAVKKLSYSISNKAVTEGISRAGRHLYRYLASIYGDATLSAQTCTPGTNDEIDAIYNATGKYPAIRFGELGGYSSSKDKGDIELAKKWWDDGGIVGYNWYWEMGGSLYLENGFDLKKAVTSLDIAAMDGNMLAERYASGDISTETLMVIDGIDLLAVQLKRLSDEKIPVIFRPLPEADSGVFWWGCDEKSYLWLYRLIFDRLGIYHGLDNLIWVWNGESERFYPGDDLVDIVSLDLYYPDGENAFQSGVNFMIKAQDISSKPAAISECAVLPRPDEMKKDNCAWLFCGVFSGEYADIDGVLSEKYMTLTDWDIFYSADNVITRDEIDYER